MASFTPPQALPTIISAKEVIPTTEKAIAEKWAVRNAVANTVTPSTACFENVIKPLIDVDNRTQGTLGVIAMLRYASLTGQLVTHLTRLLSFWENQDRSSQLEKISIFWSRQSKIRLRSLILKLANTWTICWVILHDLGMAGLILVRFKII